LFIGNDSGTSHVAAALNIPSVTLFGPSSPGLWRPAGNKSVIVYDHNLKQKQLYDTADNFTEADFFSGISPSSAIDGILLSLSRHIDRTRKPALDSVCISDHLEIADTISGVILKNTETGHACLVNSGWEYVSRILDGINELGSLEKIYKKFPEDRHLISLLTLHRIITADNPLRSAQ
jgi:hypothetical protein